MRSALLFPGQQEAQSFAAAEWYFVAPFQAAVTAAAGNHFGRPMAVNRTGSIERAPARAPRPVAEQPVHPARWVPMMETLSAMDVTHVLTPGPSRALRGLMRQYFGDRIARIGVETPRDLDRFTAVSR